MGSGGIISLPRLRVLVVDDHPAVRQGLDALLTPEGIEVYAEESRPSEVLALLNRLHPDLAIIDLSLDGENGLPLVADLHIRGVPVLVYSMHNSARHVKGAIAAGALGYVTKREFDDVLLRAIRETAAGRRFVSPVAAAALAESVTADYDGDPVETLSPRELKVYRLIGGGADLLDISAVLHISVHTVESYYSRILIKLGLNGMHDLRRHAIEYFQGNAR